MSLLVYIVIAVGVIVTVLFWLLAWTMCVAAARADRRGENDDADSG